MKKSHLWRIIEGRREYQATESIENLKDGKLVKGLVEEILNDEEHESVKLDYQEQLKEVFFFSQKGIYVSQHLPNGKCLFEHVYRWSTVNDKTFLLFVERIYVKNVSFKLFVIQRPLPERVQTTFFLNSSNTIGHDASNDNIHQKSCKSRSC
jgi:hypothetical protein